MQDRRDGTALREHEGSADSGGLAGVVEGVSPMNSFHARPLIEVAGQSQLQREDARSEAVNGPIPRRLRVHTYELGRRILRCSTISIRFTKRARRVRERALEF